jgi:uncharacterized Tic20 family protein
MPEWAEPTRPSDTAPKPGWYHDEEGAVRWWDGDRWDAAAIPPPAAPTNPYPSTQPWPAPAPGPGRSDARTLAMLAHLGVFLGGFIVPLVIYLTVGKEDLFVRHHARESLNFQLSYLIVYITGLILILVTLLIGAIVLLPVLLIVGVAHIVYAIIGAVKASQGEWWCYPITFRFVKN